MKKLTLQKACVTCGATFSVPRCLSAALNCSRVCADKSRRVTPEWKFLVKARYLERTREHRHKAALEWGRRNPEKRKAAKDKWRAKNKERTNFLTRRYIYRKKHAKGFHTFEEFKAILDGRMCLYCDTKVADTIDHVLPLSRGGTNEVTNLLPVCRSCNSKKYTKTLWEWNPMRAYQFSSIHG